ncbi:ATP-grasp domain-containing protein [Alkalihalobacillus sp. LMS39]|uniref:ATP-grasp domain-containing protein n=1 Tax=Alkalihalobacillus sp. LMS39 TaxID=2924032 RepID=UPI001FB269A4|nr:ATP-grasp domain-containing protein [Alkalihalobacillus sp. LMS39]UOE93555.1 ATP-grasp domain-containing protein [Alkalihalobacillus sp. LMS39]
MLKNLFKFKENKKQAKHPEILEKPVVLSHLTHSIPEHAKGYMLSGYSIALEGWRRGLQLSLKVIFDTPSKTRIPIITLSDGNNVYKFKYTRANTVSKEAITTCVNKELTKKALLDANVETPIGKLFKNTASDQDFIYYANEIGYPVVIKPSNGTGGKGVIGNIQSDEELVEGLQYIKEELKIKECIILEKFYKGQDHRFYVVDGKVVAAYKRDPLSVVGNGKDSIRQLLHLKELERKKNPALMTRPIKIDKETTTLLDRMGYTLDTVLKENERVFLKSKNNVTAGGDAIDMTEKVSPKMKALAISAVKAIPTLSHAGVDLIIDEETDNGAVIEINSRPHITAHLFPAAGTSRDVPSALIDYFFPETKNYNREGRANLYFDFDTIFENTYLKGNMEEVIVPSIPGDIVLKRYNLTLLEKTDSFTRWLQLTSKKNKVSGHAKLINKTLSIVLAGTESDIATLLSQINKKIKDYKGSPSLIEKKRTTPVKQGFFIDELSSQESVELELPPSYQSDVERLIQAVYDTNNNGSRRITSDEEFEVLRAQLKNVQNELEAYKEKYGEL